MTTIADIKINQDKQEDAEYRRMRLEEIEAEIAQHEHSVYKLLRRVDDEKLWMVNDYASFERYCFLRCRQ
jgi:hypothetical protein